MAPRKAAQPPATTAATAIRGSPSNLGIDERIQAAAWAARMQADIAAEKARAAEQLKQEQAETKAEAAVPRVSRSGRQHWSASA